MYQVNYSSSFLFRTACRYCKCGVNKCWRFSSIALGEKDLIKHGKYSDYDLYLPDFNSMDVYLGYRGYQKISINYFLYLYNGAINPKNHKRKYLSSIKLSEENFPTICRCKCGRSYWISYSLDKNIYPEYNRKCRYYFKF